MMNIILPKDFFRSTKILLFFSILILFSGCDKNMDYNGCTIIREYLEQDGIIVYDIGGMAISNNVKAIYKFRFPYHISFNTIESVNGIDINNSNYFSYINYTKQFILLRGKDLFIIDVERRKNMHRSLQEEDKEFFNPHYIEKDKVVLVNEKGYKIIDFTNDSGDVFIPFKVYNPLVANPHFFTIDDNYYFTAWNSNQKKSKLFTYYDDRVQHIYTFKSYVELIKINNYFIGLYPLSNELFYATIEPMIGINYLKRMDVGTYFYIGKMNMLIKNPYGKGGLYLIIKQYDSMFAAGAGPDYILNVNTFEKEKLNSPWNIDSYLGVAGFIDIEDIDILEFTQ